ncbi:MAG TPA: hypothetical protein VHU91_07045, partial [Mycobacteriales bacterium]|nr:hypothetical protein [Mycobacteriales bacterium]
MQGGPDPEVVWQQVVGADADPDAVNGALAGVVGYFLVESLLPAPPNLPTIRTFQRLQGDLGLAWLRQRLRLRA